MIRRAYHALWRDLAMEEPHPARVLSYLLAGCVLSLIVWACLVAWLIVGASLVTS
jgi:hypothetical protein